MNYCKLCFPNSLWMDEIFPGHDLLESKDSDGNTIYKIVDDHVEIIRFPSPPVKDPFYNMSDTQIDSFGSNPIMQELDKKYMECVEKFRETFVFHPQVGQNILDLCIQSGYNPEKDGWLEYWLIHRAAEIIEKVKNQAVYLPLVNKALELKDNV